MCSHTFAPVNAGTWHKDCAGSSYHPKAVVTILQEVSSVRCRADDSVGEGGTVLDAYNYCGTYHCSETRKLQLGPDSMEGNMQFIKLLLR